MTFLMNAWYMIGWGSELDGGAFVHRTVAGQPILVYRLQGGRPAAIHDRCPHRFVPLHRGRQIGDQIQCGYHGLCFGADGQCTRHPIEGSPIPKAAKVHAYPVVQRNGILWVWPGDAALADEALIAEHDFLDDARRGNVAGYAHVRASYLLSLDNLCDLTHVQFVHGEYQGSEAFSKLTIETHQVGNEVHTTLTLPGGRPPPFFSNAVPDPQQLIDLVFESRWRAPALVQLIFRAYRTGGRSQSLFETMSAHILTPENERTTHYFYVNSRDHAVGDAAADAKVREWQRIGFGEQDKPMIEAQQECLGEADVMDLKPVLLTTDAGAVRVRRVLAGLIAAERQHSTQSLP